MGAAVTGTRFKLGVQLPEVEYVASWRQHRDMAQLAEHVGLDSIWLGDHLLYRGPDTPARGPWECLSMLSALAAVTERIELGPLVLATSFRNPALTAKMAETIDEISGGRLILGLGAGWNQSEFSAFGIPYDRRVGRFAEAFTIVHDLVRSGEVDFQGEFYQARDCLVLPRGPRAGRMPLMIGSIGERMLRLTLPHVDLWNIWYADFGNTVAGLQPHVDRVRTICAELGRDPAGVGLTAAVLVRAPREPTRTPVDYQGQPIPGITGDPQEVAGQLLAFRDMGIDHLQLVLDPITAESIAWLAPIVEHVRDATPGRT